MQVTGKTFYRGRKLTGQNLKWIVMFSMFLDHFAYLAIPEGTPLRWGVHFIGRLAAPIICYLIAEGYYYTSNEKRYLGRLLLFAAISHIPYVLYFRLPFFGATSVIWSLAMGLLSLMVVKSQQLSWILKLIIVFICCLLVYNANWNFIAIFWILGFGLFRGNFKWQIASFTLVSLVLYVIRGLITIGLSTTYRFGVFFAIPLLYLYNGEQGKRSRFQKWSFYVLYPLHLIVYFLLRLYFF